MKKMIMSPCSILLFILITQISPFCFAAVTKQPKNPQPSFCCDHATKKTLCVLSNQILGKINKLSNQLSACCSTIEIDINNLNPCGRVRPLGQADIPAVINQSAYVCLKEDVLFDGSLVTSPGAEGPIGIAVNANNVVIDLNNHTLTYKGEGANGIATIGNSAHVTIKNGTIVGSNDQFTAGILLLTSNVTVKNVRIINASGAFSAGITMQGAFLPTVSTPQLILAPQDAIVIEKCDFENDFFGIELNTFSNSVIIKECTINKSIQMGITQPSRKNIAANVTIDRCTISNSGLNGIYTAFSQTNWTISNCKISNTVLNGMILAAFQNLKVTNCQVLDSGAHGIIVSIRQSQNVEIADCQIFNSQDSALRIDNVENLTISNCQITNYLTPSPTTSPPLLKVQDVFNGTISGCTFNSVAGTSDGLLLRNCHALTLEDCNAQIFCNQPRTNCPIGFNLQGDVESTVLRNCTVSGNPSVGIALQQDALNGPNSGVIIENCTVKGAVNQGIGLSSAVNCAILGCQITNCQGDGILLGTATSQNAVRDNTVINNGGFGINNATTQPNGNQIYHNFASNNFTGGVNNYFGIPASLVAADTTVTPVGVLQNIYSTP